MTTIIIIAILILCVVLGFFILVQQPKGGGLSGAFGSVGAQVMGVQRSGDAMEKGTWYTMAIIAILCIASVFTLNVPKATPQPAQQQSAPAQHQHEGQPMDAAPLPSAE